MADDQRPSGSGDGNDELSADDKRRQIAKIVQSDGFRGAPMLRSLLEYLAKETLEGRADRLKEFVIGLEAFGRDPKTFDPMADGIVRTQASNLRKKLAAYYEAEGWDDPIIVSVPKGRYVVEFRRNDQLSTAPGSRNLPVEPGLLAALEITRRHCAAQNLPYHTPSFMLGLLAAPERFFARCLDRLAVDLSVELRTSLSSYVNQVLPASKSAGYQAFAWADHEIVKDAVARANAGGLPRANEKHCLEALLAAPSNTVREFKAHLGKQLRIFEEIVREMPVKVQDPQMQTPEFTFRPLRPPSTES